MKPMIVVAVLATLLLSGCAFLSGGNEGNPYNDPYIGSPGSTYDAAANPPRTIGAVTYNPMAPLPDGGHDANTATGISAKPYVKR